MFSGDQVSSLFIDFSSWAGRRSVRSNTSTSAECKRSARARAILHTYGCDECKGEERKLKGYSGGQYFVGLSIQSNWSEKSEAGTN